MPYAKIAEAINNFDSKLVKNLLSLQFYPNNLDALLKLTLDLLERPKRPSKQKINNLFSIAKELIYLGADINTENSSHNTIINICVIRNRAGTLRRYLKYYIDYLDSEYFFKAIDSADSLGNDILAVELLEFGKQYYDYSKTFLINILSCGGSIDAVTWLLKYGCDPNSRDEENGTPLMSAANTGIEDMIVLLLNYGADISLVDDNGKNAIDWYIQYDNENSLPILKQAMENHLLTQSIKDGCMDSDNKLSF